MFNLFAYSYIRVFWAELAPIISVSLYKTVFVSFSPLYLSVHLSTYVGTRGWAF